MRPNLLLVVLLAALAVSGCARRGPQYQYMTARPAPMYQTAPQGSGYQQQDPAQVYQPQVYQAPAYQTQRPQVYQPQMYQAPTYQAPVVQAPVYQQRPVYQNSGCPAGYQCQGQAYQAPALSYQAQRPVYQPQYQALAKAPAQQPVSLPMPYTLDSGDRLRITVFGQDGLTNSYAVDAAGHITMPLIGPVAARGLTPDQLSQSISERLAQGYIREPHVALEIEAYRPFFILGEVATPGQYAYVANMTVETAVAIAGGFAPRAQTGKVTLSRNFGGQTSKATVPLSTPIRPGDTIRVQERWF
ncbi:MAG: polysaccharide biosynthesis/export protein [Alphaproteobacteria bacterium]|jgi:polysaccharide export outer membrane protein|nr:polysaccharide biosynthesis/export protein [Alphaproteobacteria bacterium]